MSSHGRPRIGVDLRALVGTVSGIGTYTRSLLLHLAQSGWADYVGMAHKEVEGAEELEDAGVQLEQRSAPLGVIWQQLYLPGRLQRGDIDLFWSPLFTLPIGIDVPSVVTIHDLTPLLHPETHTLKVRMSIRPFLSRTIAKAGRIIADSEATATDIRQHFPASSARLQVIYPGIEDIFEPGDALEIASTRKELKCPGGYFLFAGTLEPRKNVAFLLDAWESLRQEDSGVPKLVLAGGYGWRSLDLLDRIRRLEGTGSLLYLDRLERDRLVRVFQAASVFVLPSLYEGFGLPAAEAMACGIPTIVTNTSSLTEVIGDAGVTVELDDVAGLKDALRRLSRDTAWAATVGTRCRERARRFDWSRAAAEMEQVFRQRLG